MNEYNSQLIEFLTSLKYSITNLINCSNMYLASIKE